MGAPWTRDGTVRAYVVTMAPEVAGGIVELPVGDNQLVRKGELLMTIDPTNYRIAVTIAEAAVERAEAYAQNARKRQNVDAGRRNRARSRRRNWKFHETNAVVTQAQYQQALANLEQARVNLERTQIRSPVRGWVTNLLARLGDYATVGKNKLSVVDVDSFWVDGYFEETTLELIREGDPAKVKLMGYSQIVRGHVASIARASTSQTRKPTSKGWLRSTRSSPGCASPSAFRCASTSIRCRRAWSWWPG